MRSSDFLTNDDVYGHSARVVAGFTLAFLLVGLAVWGVAALAGAVDDGTVRGALGFPLCAAGLYANASLYNLRVRHDIQPFTRPWWPRITGLATGQTVLMVALSLAAERALQWLGWIGGEARPIDDVGLFCAAAGGFALLVCLFPAKDEVHL